MTARPAETRRCGAHRASAGAARADPAMTATLNGKSISPATSGLCPKVFLQVRQHGWQGRHHDGRAENVNELHKAQ